MQDVFVKSFTHLKDRSNAEQALRLLQRIASLVKPIMRKHGWVLPVLSEFFPESPNLLDVNAGHKILVRLRPPHAPNTFYDEEDIVQTMLHELTHNVHGPHDDKFYNYLSRLEEEYEALRKAGYDGEGFHASGRRLGTNVSHDLPPHLARQKALEAAEKRRQISVVLGRGGRLGGAVRSNKSPRELAAEAAERRARDEKACATGAVAQKEAEKAALESVQDDVIDLTLSSDSESEPEPEIVIVDEDGPASGLNTSNPTVEGTRSPASGSSTPSYALSDNGYSSSSTLHSGSSFSSSSSLSTLVGTSTCPSPGSGSTPPHPRPHVRRVPRGAGNSKPSLPKPRSLSRPPSRTHAKSTTTPPPTRASSIVVTRANAHAKSAMRSAVPAAEQWACPRCTLINDALALQCAACLGMRPGPQEERKTAEGWTCGVCGEREMPQDFWTCRFCGSVKVTS